MTSAPVSGWWARLLPDALPPGGLKDQVMPPPNARKRKFPVVRQRTPERGDSYFSMFSLDS